MAKRYIYIYERESEKERFFYEQRGGPVIFHFSLSRSLRGVIFFQVIRAARADRILRLLGALTNQLGLCVRFHKELFWGRKRW